MQKFGNIPEAQSDFIFAALSEEIGLVGNLFIIALYVLLGRYSIIAIGDMKDQYSKIL
ncbi:MAG: FtsW/RodA/SpoVE family cell cycle protein [Candidatus Peribacteria bacterium]|nr:MAG: FtsW/RodA/SpoVE family cell cycle protein [Candidatus Peribacteria bacterium]